MIKISQKDVEDDGRWFQAEENGEILGFASLTKEADHIKLDSLHVIPRVRRRGIGSALLKSVVEWKNNQGIGELVVGEFSPEFRGGEDEKAARKFYEKHGFTIDEENNLRGRIK